MRPTFVSTIIVAIAAVCATATDIHGAVETPVTSPVLIKNANDFVPAVFTSDGKPMLSFTDFDQKNGTATVQIIDASIKPVTDFIVPENPNTVFKEASGKAWQNMYWDTVERDTVTVDYSVGNVEDFLAKTFGVKYKFIAKYCTTPSTSDGEVYGNMDSSFETLSSKAKVIKEFVYHTKNYWIKVKCSGKCKVEIETDYSSTPSYRISPIMTMSLFNYDEGASSIGNIAVTQTLFNENSDFEYIAPIYGRGINSESHYFSYGYVYDFGYYAFEGDGTKQESPGECTGFSIIGQGGNVLQSVNFEDGFRANGENFMSIIIIGGKTYLTCNLISKDDKSYTVLYEVNKAHSGVRNAATFKASVHPTLVSRGENVIVDLEDTSDEDISVSVSDMSGRMIYQAKHNPEEGSMAISTQSMSSGLNIVTVNGDKSGKSSTKVLVR